MIAPQSQIMLLEPPQKVVTLGESTLFFVLYINQFIAVARALIEPHTVHNRAAVLTDYTRMVETGYGFFKGKITLAQVHAQN